MNVMRSKYQWIILSILLLGLSFSCKKGSSSSGTIYVPQKEKIPHYNDLDNILISKKRSFDLLSDKTPLLIRLHQYLTHPEDFNSKKIDTDTYTDKFISLDNNRILMLDTFNDRLVEYNFKTESTQIIASRGRGPGDLINAQEMVKRDSMIYVVQKMQISKFICETNSPESCVFSGSIPLRYMPHSLALVGDSIAILGFAPQLSLGHKKLVVKDDLNDLKPVHVLAPNGHEVGAFGNVYQTDGHWMFMNDLVFHGLICYSPAYKLYFLAFNELPILYTYDNHFRLRFTYKISDFILPRFKYLTKSGAFGGLSGNYSNITNIKLISNKDLLITEDNIINQKIDYKKHEIISGHRIEFYVLDLRNKKNYFIGELKTKKSSSYQTVCVTQRNIIRIKDNNMYLVTKK